MDLNHWPSGYEPNELPNCSTPRSNMISHFKQKERIIIK